MAIRRLPLFPLSTVLFPGMTLPIQVFELRYRHLLRDCLRADRRFGVVFIKRGGEVGDPDVEPRSVGTIGEIQKIGPASRGLLPVTVLGEQRFRIVELDRSRPYLVASVEILEDDDEDGLNPGLLDAARALCSSYLSTLLASHGMWHTEMRPLPEAAQLACLMGILCQAAPPESLQVVLEGGTLAERLQAATALLAERLRQLEPGIMRAGPGSKESLFSSN